MAYREGIYKGNPAWVGIVVFLLMLGWCVARPGGFHARATPEKVATELMNDPEGGPIFKAIRESFPQDMDRLTADLSNRANNGEAQQALEVVARDFVTDLSRQHRGDLVNAPHQSLAAIEQAHAALVDYLHGASPTLCAKFDVVGVSLNDLPVGEARQRLTALMAAKWRAMGAGRDAPVTRNSMTLTPLDGRALLAAMRHDGLSASEDSALRSGSPSAVVGPEVGCGIAIHTIRAIQALPADQGDRVMAWSLRRQVG